MEKEANKLVNSVAHKITINLVKNFRMISVFLFVLSACLLLTIKSYICTVCMFVFCLFEFLIYTLIVKKNIITLYYGLAVSFLFSVNFVLSCNVWLYCIQNILKCYDSVMYIITIFIELICIVIGYFYTIICVKKGYEQKKHVAITLSTFMILPSALGYCLSKYMIEKTSLYTQNVFFTIVFALGGSILMFVIGMYHISSMYYIKKYKIINSIVPLKENTNTNDSI